MVQFGIKKQARERIKAAKHHQKVTLHGSLQR
jgi:hypothetical protein